MLVPDPADIAADVSSSLSPAAAPPVTMSKCRTRTSLMKPQRTGFMVCKGAKGPTSSSHHSAASASNFAVSRGSTVSTPKVDADADAVIPRLPCHLAAAPLPPDPPSVSPNLLIVAVAVAAAVVVVVVVVKKSFRENSRAAADDAARRQDAITPVQVDSKRGLFSHQRSSLYVSCSETSVE